MLYDNQPENSLILRVYLSTKLYEELKERARQCQRHVSQQVRFLIVEDLKHAPGGKPAKA